MPRVRVQPAYTAGVMQQINSSMPEENRGILDAVGSALNLNFPVAGLQLPVRKKPLAETRGRLEPDLACAVLTV